ncbi:MAG: hypothetical protein KDE27_21000 [Planctomycetes bacterium]|nr:hypothetical protein [Planctomycetota bacterium]
MTLSNLPFSATRLTLAALLAVSTAFAQGSGPDDGALWQPMFDSSGAIPPSGIVALHGGPPPVLGSTTAVQVLAPGFQFAFVAVSLGANEGYPVQIGLESLDIYIDPLLSLGTYAVPIGFSGQGQLALPLPPDPLLSGLEPGFQGLVLDPTGNVAATNLLAGNFGLVAGAPVQFAFAFGGNSGVSISAGRYWRNNQNPSTIVNNATAAAKDYTFHIEKSASQGVLELRDQNGVVLATVGGSETATSVTITVPAGSQVRFFNSGGATINGLKWSVDVG